MSNRYDFEDLRRACNGQWSTIIGALSHVDLSDAIANGGRRHVHCHRDHSKKKTFRVFPNFEETGGAICTPSCGSWPDGFELLAHTNGWDRKQAVKEIALYLKERGQGVERREAPVTRTVVRKPKTFQVAPQNASKLEKIWLETTPLADTVGEKYLRDRGIRCDLPLDDEVRFHPALPYWDADTKRIIGEFPAIVSQLRSAEHGFPLTLHRIYLDPAGGKAKVESAKKLLPCAIEGAISELGAAIRLFAIDGPYLAITEGIETALAVRSAHPALPVWATYSAGVLKKFRPPRGIKGVYIFGDVDLSSTGQMTATELAIGLEKDGIKAKICLPAPRFCIAGSNSGWFRGSLSRSDFLARFEKDGYTTFEKDEDNCRDIDWLDVWNASRERLLSVIPRRA